jgi:lysophospholipase L1-like esterase
MQRLMPTRLMIAILVLGCIAAAARADDAFELRDGDRVVLIGNTFVEREQTYSYLETLLMSRWPERKITFRNLGWSGDTVIGDARGYEHGADQGFERLRTLVHELKPTAIFIGYGMGESFAGEAGLSSFREGYGKLLDMLKDLKARTVLIGPIAHEKLPPPMPDPAEHNRSLKIYSDAIADIAAKRGCRFVDLLDMKGDANQLLTANGIHLTEAGYRRAAETIAQKLNVSPVALNEKIRQLAIQKNIQYFNQWRPANEPYIFGFRKQEQSRNRVELPRFTQPIEELEKQMYQILQSAKTTP